MEKTRFGRDEIPNPAAGGDLSALQRLVGPAVDAMREELKQARRAFDDAVRPELDRQLERLASFRDARNLQLELRFEKMSHVRDAEKRKVADLYEQYKKWIRNTLETEDHPSIRVTAIFTGKGGK
jgi:flagellar motility protein MotE (MotC chaperone)